MGFSPARLKWRYTTAAVLLGDTLRRASGLCTSTLTLNGNQQLINVDQICENTTRSSVFSFYSLKITKTHEERKSCCIFMNFTIYILHTLDRGTSLRFRSSDFLYTLSSFDLLIVHPSFILGSGDDLERVQRALFRFLGSPRT